VKDVIEVDNLYNKTPALKSTPTPLEMHFNEITKEPFVFKSLTWTTSTPIGELARVTLPQDLLINDLIKMPFNFSSYYTIDMCVLIQTAGTMKHQGCMIVAALPHATPTITNINQILAAPHAFLNANEANPVCLPCPFYINGNVAQSSLWDNVAPNAALARQPLAFCELVFFVINPLAASTGSSTSLSISLSAQVKQCRFFGPNNRKSAWIAQGSYQRQGLVEDVLNVPTMILDSAASGLKGVVGDIIDIGRSTIRNLTGFHNPNDPVIEQRVVTTKRNFQNNVDSKVCMEVLDNHSKYSRIYDDYYFHTDIDEMNLTHLLSKPVYVGTFNIDTNTIRGTNLMAYPITPMVEIAKSGLGYNDTYCSTMRLLYESSKFWRGGLKLHIQSVCTSFHFTKLCVVKVYSPGRQALALTPQVMKYADVINMPTDVIEFSNGGQIQTIELPYCSDTKQLDCTKDYIYNAVNHGLVYIYLETPLAISEGVPSNMSFNVYISGAEDLEFAGYASDLVDRVVPPPPSTLSAEGTIKRRNMVKQSAKVVSLVSDQSPILNEPESGDNPLEMSFQPNVSLRDYLRIMQPLDTFTISETSDSPVYAYNVAEMLYGLKDFYKTSNQALMRDFLGLSGGVKVRFKITGCANAKISYLPPSTMAINSSFGGVYPTSGTTPLATTGELYTQFHKSTGFMPDTSYTSPQVDGAEYVYPDTSISAVSPIATASVYHNIVIIEATIPNMNLNNFVGTSHKWSYMDFAERSVNEDMGIIFIHARALGTPETPVPISILPYIGLSDEARVGFHVFNPTKTVSHATNEGKKYRLTHYSPSAFIHTYVDGMIINPNATATSSYYFKT